MFLSILRHKILYTYIIPSWKGQNRSKVSYNLFSFHTIAVNLNFFLFMIETIHFSSSNYPKKMNFFFRHGRVIESLFLNILVVANILMSNGFRHSKNKTKLFS